MVQSLASSEFTAQEYTGALQNRRGEPEQRMSGMNKKNVFVGAAFVAALATLGAAQSALQRAAAAQGKGAAGAALRSRPDVAEAAAEPLAARQRHRRRRRQARPHLHRSSRRRDARPQGDLRAAESADVGVLPPAPPVLVFDARRQSRQIVGRPRPGLRVAGVEPRHHARQQGQRLASAATAATTATS